MTENEKNTSWDDGLSVREKIFVEAYCTDQDCFLNASKSYYKAYKNNNETSCKSCGSRLAKKENVKEAITKLLSLSQSDIDVKEKFSFLKLINTVLHTSPADIYEDDGTPKPLSELGDKAYAIANVSRNYINDEGEVQVSYTMAKKDKYLEVMARYLNLLQPEETTVKVDLPVVEVSVKADTIEAWNKANSNEA